MALRQHVELLILRQELHVDALAHRLPGQRRRDASPVWTAAPWGCRPDRKSADRPRASRPAPPRSECRDPSPRCGWPCRIGLRSCAACRATWCCRRCCRAAPRSRAESPRASRSARSPPARSRCACRGCSHGGACPFRRPAAATRNRCWSGRTAARRTSRANKSCQRSRRWENSAALCGSSLSRQRYSAFFATSA